MTFPTYFTEEHALSMTLCDYFAAKAMQSMANDCLGQDNDKLWEQELNELVEMSYSVADAMIKARKK